MLALRKTAAEPGLRLDEVPVPVPLPDEVLVEVETASVCGTDLHIYGWDEWSQGRIEPPLTLGHEFAGTVVERGELVRNVAVGDYVSAESHITCGMCFQCRTGHAHMCERTRILGVDRDGAFARYVAVPESVIWQNDRSKLPPEIATLQEPFGNAVFATSEQDLAGRSVAVLGCGPIGLFTIGIARASGAAVGDRRRPNAVPARARREDGRERGRQRRRDAGHRGLVPGAERGLRIRRRLRDVRLAARDRRLVPIARNGGRVILFGIPSRPVEIDVAESLIFKNLNVLALNGRKIFETWYRTRWLLESGVVDLRPLITKELPLEEYEDGVRAARSGRGLQDRRSTRAGGRRAAAAEDERAREPCRLESGRWQHR